MLKVWMMERDNEGWNAVTSNGDRMTLDTTTTSTPTKIKFIPMEMMNLADRTGGGTCIIITMISIYLYFKQPFDPTFPLFNSSRFGKKRI